MWAGSWALFNGRTGVVNCGHWSQKSTAMRRWSCSALSHEASVSVCHAFTYVHLTAARKGRLDLHLHSMFTYQSLRIHAGTIHVEWKRRRFCCVVIPPIYDATGYIQVALPLSLCKQKQLTS